MPEDMFDQGLTAGAHQGNTPVQRCRAVRVVAAAAEDAEDAAYLLAMLGLDASEARGEETAA